MSPVIFIKAASLLLITLLLAGCYKHLGKPAESNEQATSKHYEIETELVDLVYSAPGWAQELRADLYLPERSGRLPVVMTVHGGGWANRSRDDMTSISRKLAERGYAVFNLDYRFAPEFRYPAQIEDLQQALAWVTNNADKYQLDITRINAWGYSSGAHLAALLGAIESPRPDDPAGRLPRLRAVVAGGIPADLRVYEDSPIVKRFMGGVPSEMPARYAEASPLYHVSADDPAVFLYHGKLDRLVLPEQSGNYYDALLAAGIDSELFLHNWREHMTMFLFGSAAEKRAIDFLERNNSDTGLLANGNS